MGANGNVRAGRTNAGGGYRTGEIPRVSSGEASRASSRAVEESREGAAPRESAASRESEAASEDARRQGGVRRPSVAGRRRADGESARSQRSQRSQRAPRRKWPKVVALSVLGVAVVALCLLAWQRWLRYDDAHDVQGAWQVAGTAVTVSVDGSSIRITDDVAYHYELDSGAKTFALSFGEYSGSGHYWFSFDRQTLVFIDGNFAGISVLAEDIAWSWEELVASVQGREPVLPSGENVVVLKRVAEGAS